MLPARWSLVAASAAVLVAAMWLPDYRLVGAPFLAYALVTAGALIRVPRLHLGNDISYGLYIYAFPVQQLLIVAGLGALVWWRFAALAGVIAAVLAALSWFVVEKPAMKLK